MFVNFKDNYRPWILPQINLYRYQCYYNLHKSTQRSLSATARHLYIYRARGNKYPRNSGYGTGRPNFVAATPCAYHHISVPDDRWDDEYILVDMLLFLSLVWSMAMHRVAITNSIDLLSAKAEFWVRDHSTYIIILV